MPVTWKAMVFILAAAVGGQGTTLVWMDGKLDDKVDVSAYVSNSDDIKWIKACMIKKCWDTPKDGR